MLRSVLVRSLFAWKSDGGEWELGSPTGSPPSSPKAPSPASPLLVLRQRSLGRGSESRDCIYTAGARGGWEKKIPRLFRFIKKRPICSSGWYFAFLLPTQLPTLADSK